MKNKMKQKVLDECDLSPFTAEEIADMYLRADLTVTLSDYFSEQNIPIEQISRLLEIAQPWVRDLLDGKAEKFSSAELLDYCSKVGLQFEPFSDIQWS